MEDHGVDLNQAARLVELLTGRKDPEVTFQTFDDDKGRNDPALEQVLHGTLNHHAEKLCELNRLGAAICISVNRTDLYGRKKENITAVQAFIADHDKQPIREHEVTPSFYVKSSPNKRHDWWLVEPGFPVDWYVNAMKSLQTHLGSDPKVCISTAVLRLPGFFHQKGDPFLVQLVDGTGIRYRAEDVLAPTGWRASASRGEPKPRKDEGPLPAGNPNDRTRESRRIRVTEFLRSHKPAVSGDGGHQTTFWVACEVVARFGGLSDDDLVLACQRRSNSGPL